MELPKIWGSPLIFLQWPKLATSNLVCGLGLPRPITRLYKLCFSVASTAFGDWGQDFPLSPPSLLFFLSFFSPSLPPSSPSLNPVPSEVGLMKTSYGVWGSAVNSRTGVRGGAPAEKAFLAYFEPRKRVWWKRFSYKYIVSKYHVNQNLNITESYSLQVTILMSKQQHFSIRYSCKACHKVSV